MGAPFRDLTGQRFGHLVVLSREVSKKSAAVWRCLCDCGNETLVITASLNNGHSTGCGCHIGGTTHGHTRGGNGKCSLTYSSWKAMIARCTHPSSAGYAHYKKHGITVCERWRTFANFLADMGERPGLSHTLDRFPEKSGNYEPGNCRWATRREQANNRSTNRLFLFQGEQLTYREVARRVGLNDELVRHRLLRAGWSVEDAANPQHVQGRLPFRRLTRHGGP